MFYKIILILMIGIVFNANAKVCNVEKNVLYSIMKNESHPKRKVGYEYLISFNNSKDSRRIRKILPEYFLDSRTIDCKNLNTCKSILTALFKYKIRNLDLGAYQINSYYHKMRMDSYFKIVDSYKFARKYVCSKIKKYGYNWYAMASYHSETKSLNYKYQKNLIKNYFHIKEVS